MSEGIKAADYEVIDATRNWVQRFVIELGLCPFAAKPFMENRIEYRAMRAPDLTTLVEAVSHYIVEFLDSEFETGLLVCPSGLDDFLEYLDVLDVIQMRLQQDGYEGVVQLASFHPDYQFSGARPDDVANYTNRSPYPMFHVLREASVSRAVEQHPNIEAIPENNIQTLRSLGVELINKTLSNL